MTIRAFYPLTTPAGTNEQTGVGQITVTASGNSREYPELASFQRGILFLDVSAVSGTPTIDVTLQVQDPASGKWQAAVAAFAQQTAITGATPLVAKTVELYGLNYRLAWVVGGGTPSVTFSCGIVCGCEEPIP